MRRATLSQYPRLLTQFFFFSLKMSLDESLSKIRAYKSSKIPLQVKQATLLSAIESTIDDSPTPTAYYGALVSLLDQPDASAPAVVYLLSLVIPHVSQTVLNASFEPVVQKLAPLLTSEDAESSLLRSCIKVLEVVLSSQSFSAWQIPFSQLGPLRAFSGLLALCQDSRPKVRRSAVEAVANILLAKPPGPKAEHPALALTADNALNAVKNAADGQPATLIHCLQFLKAVVQAGWPANRYEALCETLLAYARTNDQYVVMAVFDAFDALFASIVASAEIQSKTISAKTVEHIVNTIRELAPAKSDKQLAPSWFAALAQSVGCWAILNSKAAFKVLPDIFEDNVGYFESEVPQAVVESCAQCCVVLISEVISPELALSASSKDTLEALSKVVFQLLHAQYQNAWREICQVFVAFLDIVGFKAPLEDSIRVIGVLRSDERLGKARNYTDSVISAAIRAYGPQKLLELIPLQLSTEGGGRVWMLPLLRENIQNARLQHFQDYFIPLAREFDQKSKGMSNPRNAKIIATVRDQIWSLLPHYCELPRDIQSSFSKDFVQLLLSVLYEQPEYRTLICQSLRILVQSTEVYSTGVVENELLLAEYSVKKAKASIEYIAKNFAIDILKALLNVYSEVAEQTRPVVLETLDVYLGLITGEEISQLFDQISSILFENLQSGKIDTCVIMLDVISVIVPHLDTNGFKIFYNIFSSLAPRPNDHALQKKVYGAFARLQNTESGKALLQSQAASIADQLIELSPTVSTPARRTRMESLETVLQLLDSKDLYFIPATLSEVMLCTKDVNEKTRDAAYSVLVLMGERCKEGGIIDHDKLSFMDDDNKVEATLDEFLTMIMAGLLGSTPHMISASIQALSYVFHHFHDDIDEQKANEIVETVWMFLGNSNREIVNSVLGFVKVCIIALPAEVLRPHVKSLIENLLEWNKEHSHHFKSKIRHLIERLIRKFGYEYIKEVFPEEHLKHLQNIQKSKLRSKRKKNNAEGSGHERQFEDELDEALYNSSDSEDDAGPSVKDKKEKKGAQYILDDDDPLDLMDVSAMSRISSSKPQQQKKRELRHKFKENKEGKIVIRDEDDNGEDIERKSAINAYLDAVRTGPVRTQSGKFKYRRGKRSQEEIESDGEAEPEPKKPANRKFAKPKARFPKRRRL